MVFLSTYGEVQVVRCLADMATRMKLQGKVTNHSLRATTASRLYYANCDEQLVMERTCTIVIVFVRIKEHLNSKCTI